MIMVIMGGVEACDGWGGLINKNAVCNCGRIHHCTNIGITAWT